jgi:4-hydroxybenzoate polyprenyltransferase
LKALAIIELLRPKHWIKNGAVLLPLIMSGNIGNLSAILLALAAAGIFCLLSSAVYAFNDISDIKHDAIHPHKKNRPLVSGRVSVREAIVAGTAAAVTGFICAFIMGSGLPLFAGAYFLLQLLYSFGLKRVVLLDVILIAIGFVFRASAGAVAIGVIISPWLFVCMFTMCMFMGFCKRYGELITLDEASRLQHRLSLRDYSIPLLTHLITLSAAVALMGFLAWAMSPETSARIGSDKLVYTFPVITYGTFRFAYISMRADHEGPVEIFLRDKPFMASVIIWCVIVAILCTL